MPPLHIGDPGVTFLALTLNELNVAFPWDVWALHAHTLKVLLELASPCQYPSKRPRRPADCCRPRSEAADVLRCRSCIVVSKGGDPIPHQERDLPCSHGRLRTRSAPAGRLPPHIQLVAGAGEPPRVRPAQEASPSEILRHARGTGDQTPGALAPTTGGSTSLCRLPRDEGTDEGAAGGWHYPDVGPTTGSMAPATPGRCEKEHH